MTDIEAVLQSFLPDIIITDNFVGEGRAADIIKKTRLLNQFKTTPVILFSAYPDIKALSVSIGATAYLSKPFEIESLHCCIENAVLNTAKATQ